MWQSLINGLTSLGAPEAIGLLLLGCAVGTLVGAIPGLGGAVLLTLLLPFLYGMGIIPALALMLGAHTGIYFSGSVTAILFNTPGAPESAATTFDGYQMTLKGLGRRALGISATSTTIGGWIGVAVLFIFIPLMSKLTTLFHASEYLALAILAIVLIGQLRSRSVTKALLSGALGLMTAFVGYDPITGVQRFTGGLISLYNGFNITAVALGLFAVAEMYRIFAAPRAVKGGSGVIDLGSKEPGTRIRDGIHDVATHKWLTLRSAIIGTLLGIVPGVGGVAANFVSYGQAVRTSRHPERFGTGTPEGIIAPESSSISKEAGNLVPTVALGVPGGVGMAVLMSGFTILGMTPGPSMVAKHLNAIWAMAFVIAIASLLASLIGLGVTPALVRLARIPSRTLVPFIIALGFLGVYAASDELSQTIAVVGFGIVGWAMIRFGYSVPATMIGFLLGTIVEDNLYLTSNLQGWGALKRPLTAILVLITLLLLFGPAIRRGLRRVPWRTGRTTASVAAGATGTPAEPTEREDSRDAAGREGGTEVRPPSRDTAKASGSGGRTDE